MSDGGAGDVSEGQRAACRDAITVLKITAQAFLLRAVANADELTPHQRKAANTMVWNDLQTGLVAVHADNIRSIRAQCDVALSTGLLRLMLDADDTSGADAAAADLEGALDALELLNPSAHVDYSARIAEVVQSVAREVPRDSS